MNISMTRIAGCISGLRYRADRLPQTFRPQGAFNRPELVARVALATPQAFNLLMKDEQLQDALADEGFSGQMQAGLQFRYYHGRGTRTCLGMYLAYLDEQVIDRLPHLKNKRNIFAAIAGKEQRLFEAAHQQLFNPTFGQSRDLLFRCIGIENEGLTLLSTSQYLRLLGRLHRFEISERTPLDDFSSITVISSSEKIEIIEEIAGGLALTISIGQLEREAWQATISQEDPLNPFIKLRA